MAQALPNQAIGFVNKDLVANANRAVIAPINNFIGAVDAALPRTVKLSMASIADSALYNINPTFANNVELQCSKHNSSVGDVCGSVSGTLTPVGTRCSMDSQCTASATCVSPSVNLFANCAQNASWQGTCTCSVERFWHCNIAAGMCEVGISPWKQPPLQKCPSQGKLAFVDTYITFNARCYIAPTWSCHGITDEKAFGICRKATLSTGALGPYLCREYCAPTPFNVDNQLVQVRAYRFSFKMLEITVLHCELV